jgi:hypothetical protein
MGATGGLDMPRLPGSSRQTQRLAPQTARLPLLMAVAATLQGAMLLGEQMAATASCKTRQAACTNGSNAPPCTACEPSQPRADVAANTPTIYP